MTDIETIKKIENLASIKFIETDCEKLQIPINFLSNRFCLDKDNSIIKLTLDLNHNINIDAIRPLIFSLKKLSLLVLHHSRLSIIDEIISLKELKELDLSSCNIKDISTIAHLKKLKKMAKF